MKLLRACRPSCMVPRQAFAVLLGLMWVGSAVPARAAITVFERDDFSLAIAMRMQPRMELERITGDWRRDFLVRRTRLGASGKFHGTQYKLEWKIDGVDQHGATGGGANPGATAENAYIQFPLKGTLELRAGLYDLPYSRDRLTSDSRQLAVDRGAVSNVPNTIGMVDNAVGFHFLGKADEGRVEYAVGLFDNRTVVKLFQDTPMVTGRLDLNLGSTKDVFMDAHFGEDRWYSLGVNGSYATLDSTGADGSNSAIGADGMFDVPLGSGRFFARAEVNLLQVQAPGSTTEIGTTTWMVGAGILLLQQRLQPIVRFDQVRYDDLVGGGTDDITHVGFNWYRNGHNLKFQTDVRLEGDTGEAVDGVRFQAQIDY